MNLNLDLSVPALMRDKELLMVFSLVYSKGCKSCLEIGSWWGGSAHIIYQALEANGSGKLVCLDAIHQANEELRKKMSNRVTFLRGISPRDIGKAVDILGSPIDFAFIDGDHSYESVLADCRGVEPHLSHDALLLFHDISMESVKEAILDWMGEVKMAYCGGLSEVYTSTFGGYGLGLVSWSAGKPLNKTPSTIKLM